MMWLANGEQMRDIDKKAIEDFGIPGALLMEAAAAFAARVALDVFQPKGPVVVVAGAGNNGGDGWGIARHLAASKVPVKVVTAAAPEGLRGDGAVQFRIFDNYRLPWELYNSEAQFNDCALLIDALLGTGVQGKPKEPAAKIIAAINRSPAPVLAVDIPSGLPPDCTPPLGDVVQAAVTVTFGLAKAGLYTPAGRMAAGKVYLDPIGLPASLLTETGLILNTAAHASRGLPKRNMDSHKGSYGHGLLVAGSRGMSGAAMLAGNSALKTGIGLLTIACPDEVHPIIAANLWEALGQPLPGTKQGTFSPEAAAQIDTGKFTAAAIGPGCRVCPGTRALADLLVQSDLALAIDADGLNAIAPGFPRRDFPTVISPHPGEMARLLGINIEKVIADPLHTARMAAQDRGCTVILKGATTYIAQENGGVAMNITGTDGLATGGSGDVLTGLVLGFLAQGVGPFAAACAATWLLGIASELAAEKLGTSGQLPRDVQDYLPRGIQRLREFST